jgi:hypothetical protein
MPICTPCSATARTPSKARRVGPILTQRDVIDRKPQFADQHGWGLIGDVGLTLPKKRFCFQKALLAGFDIVSH